MVYAVVSRGVAGGGSRPSGSGLSLRGLFSIEALGPYNPTPSTLNPKP